MLMKRLALAAFGMSCLLMAQEKAGPETHVTKTERVDFPSGGVLRLTHSVGELTVEGWDRPDMEITTTKSPPLVYDSRWREKPARDGQLEKVHVTVERHDKEIDIVTAHPRRSGVLVDYRIQVPRSASLIVAHKGGEVHVEDLAGDIHATVRGGEITLCLPPEGPYAIDARSRWGDVISDFPGSERRRFWLIGHRFAPEEMSGHKLYLRAAYGDIIIQKIRTPPAR